MVGENYVVKANKLIEAKGRLSVVEQKLFASLISEITPEDKDFKKYRLDIKDVSEFMNLSSNAVYDQIKTASRNLRNKEILIENIDEKGKKSFLATGLFSSAKYKEGEGYLEIRIDPDLKPYLLAINGKETPFTKYLIKNILKLNSSHAIRIYELLKQCEGMKKRKFEIDKLKELLGIANEYDRFYDFEKRVLSVAKKEINDKTDIFITYKKIKTGRRISHIEFEIETKYGYFDSVEEEHKENEKEGNFDYNSIKIKSGMENEKLSRKQIMEIYEIAIKKTENSKKSPFEYIRYYYNDMLKKDNVDTKFGYLKNSLKKDYLNFTKQTTIDEVIGG